MLRCEIEYTLHSSCIFCLRYSFGQSAIFLLGGQTKDETPTAMYLHSGDIILMGGPSRLAYHALPKILPCNDGQVPTCLKHIAAENRKEKIVSSHCVESVLNTEMPKDSNCSDTGSVSQDQQGEKTMVGQKRNLSADETSPSTTDNTQDPKLVCKALGAMHSKTKQLDKLEDEGLSHNEGTICTEINEALSIDAEVQFLCCHDNWEPFVQYLSNSRINVSVRQVTKTDGRFPITQT